MKHYTPAILIISAILTGCAQPANYGSMTVNKNQMQAKILTNPKFEHKLTINSITGGEETHPLLHSSVSNNDFKQALNDSLKSFSYISKPQSAQYNVNAEILELNHPMVGINFTATSVIKYKVIEIKNNKLVFDDKIQATYSAKFNDALVGTKRLRLAIEGSVKNNIKIFLQKLGTSTR